MVTDEERAHPLFGTAVPGRAHLPGALVRTVLHARQPVSRPVLPSWSWEVGTIRIS
jgi:hypothetical protein